MPPLRIAEGRAPAGLGHRSDIASRINQIAAAFRDVTGLEITLPTLAGGSILDAAEAIAELSAHISPRIGMENATERRRQLVRLLNDLHCVALDVHLRAMNNVSTRLSGASEALAQLRMSHGTKDMLEKVCEEVVRGCKFDRVVLSRVNGNVWNPWLAHSTANDDLNVWFPGWVGSSINIDASAPEQQILNVRRPVLVRDTATALVHRPIIVDAGQSRSYVVAPLILQGTIVGFLHADHLADHSRVAEVDCDVLWAFASGLSFLYERATLHDALRQHRQEAHDILSSAAESIMSFAEQETVSDTARGPLELPGGHRKSAPWDELTRREGEVLRHMADGLTNATIADRLVLSPDTIKSHVKNILRKLNVSNRSQAVTAYLRY